jgi:hypothetical protein
MQPRKEQRLVPRQQVEQRVWVRWVDASGIPLGGRARSVDVSERGVRVLLERRVDLLSYVHVECHALKIAGLAVVRHCSRHGMGWVAGLQVSSRSNGGD